MTSRAVARAYGARSPRSHYDVILTVASFATELVTPLHCYGRTDVRADTLPRLIYKDVKKWRHKSIRAHVVMAVVLTATTLKLSRLSLIHI